MIARVLAVFLLAMLVSLETASANVPDSEIITSDLIIEHATVAPGEESTIALDMKLEEGWHTYWKNAGDSGQPIQLDWQSPSGVSMGAIRWPAPLRQPYEPLMNYGYSDAATLLIPIQVPETWPLGKPVELSVDVYWLVCRKVCIPTQKQAALTVPTGPETIIDQSLVPLFAAARAALPQASPYPSRYQIEDSVLKLRFDSADLASENIEDLYFFPDEADLIDHAAKQVRSIDPSGLALLIPLGLKDDALSTKPLSGVLEVTGKSPSGAMRITLEIRADPGVVTVEQPGIWGAASVDMTLPVALALAFLGGIILNLMPCVFPILALKTLGFAEATHADHKERIAHGVAYTAGVLALFGLLALTYVGLRSTGVAVGWGFQLQNPLVVALLAYILFLVGLNLSGVFEIGSRIVGLGSGQANRSGTRGAFFTGALAAVVATPCTAPFMAAAMGATLMMSAPATLAIFAALGLGLAAPFLILSFLPGAVRWMPAVGPWMLRLKQFLAFPMYATAVWLVWVLGSLSGPDAVLAAMAGGVLLGLAAWAYGAGQSSGARGRFLGYSTAAVGLAVALLLTTQMTDLEPRSTDSARPTEQIAEVFTADRLAELRAQGKPVFINVTADWCITCKINERVALDKSFEDALAVNEVTYLKGDWTNGDPEITALLARFGRAGVPLYAVFPRDGAPIPLPQILTPSIVLDALDNV